MLMRKVGAESIVLLKNTRNVLPLKPEKLAKVAIVGGNAKATVLSGGGSAALKPSYFVSPYQGIVNALAGSNVQVTYSEGARTYMSLPTLENDLVTPIGERGWIGTWHKHESDDSLVAVEEPLETRLVDETRIFISTSTPKNITRKWTLRLRGHLKPRPYDCAFEFGLTVAGRAKLYIDGNLVIDNWTRQRRGDAFFGNGTQEEKGIYQLKANKVHEVFVDFCNVRGPADGDEDEAVMDSNPGVRLGGAEVIDPNTSIAEAVQLAKEADVVIAVVGLNADWETEGYDRTTLALPGRTDELVAKVAEANPHTVVVTQSVGVMGSSITLPWVDKVSALIHAWYLGNSTGDAIADVLFGKHNPSGKLPLTFPKRIEDVPSYGHFHSENGKVLYSEDLFVGYKHYHHRNIEPLFPFGFGLSYTTFALSDLQLSAPVIADNEFSLTVFVTVTNTGALAGSEVVQLYVTQPETSDVTHAPLQLKTFAKVRNLRPGASERVELSLDKYAVSYWEERFETWTVEKGLYDIKVGVSSDALNLSGNFTVSKGFEWNGI
ncbi:hypothetical protein C0992_008611 [Termitomyces sp. T32_za158]|nr:hypothetical protein C0992_008611 [Termitomyces sp. T32_za158]